MTFMSPRGSFMFASSRPVGTGGGFLPDQLDNLEAWFRFNFGITVTGAGVSTWADQSGNGNDLLQTTDANRPSLESDGAILFDGIDHHLSTGAFTLVQPETYYLLFNQKTWTNNDYISDGKTTTNLGAIFQSGSSPDYATWAGAGIAAITTHDVDTYGIVSVVFNSTLSVVQHNKNAPNTGDSGTNDMGGFTLGVRGLTNARWSNIEVKEAIIYSVAHDAATRTQIINYLSDVGGLGL